MEEKSLFEWGDVFFEYVGFLSAFLMLGAVGFRYAVLRSAGEDGRVSGAVGRAAARAAAYGAFGVVLGVVSAVHALSERAAAKHMTFGEAASAGGVAIVVQVVLLAIMLVSFPLASRGVARGWSAAGVASVAYSLRGIIAGRPAAMVNPLHVLGASLWLGTLLMLVVCGLGEVLRPSIPAQEREAAAKEMVQRFSGLALFGAGLLGVTGVITGWKHLKRIESLWTTPYGLALDRKLVVVLAVIALGAWNWRRVGPSLGSEGGALKIRRTATTELALAAVVLLLTAILVSVPSPK